MNESVGHQLDRTDQEIVFRVVSSYYEVLLAAKELEVAGQSAQTANSIMERSQARFDSGLTVESDLLTGKCAHGGATAGKDPRQEHSGSGSCTVEHGDGYTA